MSSFRHSIVAITIGAGMALSADAQTTLPPPPERPALPEYVPPAKRERPQANPGQARQNQAAPKFDPTTVEFEPIWHALDDGTIVGPDGYYEVAALKNNPLIDEDLWSFIEVLLEDRHKEMELVAQAHPRECVVAVTTAITQFDVRDESSRIPLANVSLALNQPGGVIGYLAEQGIISPEMSTMSHHIAMDYTRNTMAGIEASLPEGTEPLVIVNHQSKFLVRQGLAEPLMAFGRLARRAIESDPSLVENAEELLALEGDAFVDASAAALAHLSDEELKAVITKAYEQAHGPVGG